MKLWKKMILSITGVLVLAGGAFCLPQILNHYNDERYVNKINYLDAGDMDVFSYNKERNMTDTMGILGNILENSMEPEVIEIPYVITEEQEQNLIQSTKQELKKWFQEKQLGISFTDLGINFEKHICKGYKMYSLYYENISYIKIVLEFPALDNDSQEFLFTVYMDSSSHKIYLATVSGTAYEVWLFKKKGMFQNSFETADKIRNYYEVEQEVADDYYDYQKILYLIGNTVVWEINMRFNEEGEIALFMGVQSFFDFFSYDSYSKANSSSIE